MPKIKVFRSTELSKMPTQANDKAQCIDFYSAQDAIIYPGQTVVLDLGINIILPKGYALEFRERSGLAAKGLIIGAGVIDEDYHGPLKAVVRFMSMVPPVGNNTIPPFNPIIINIGDKIVQGELVRRIPIKVEELYAIDLQQAIDDSERGEKGFGSSDGK